MINIQSDAEKILADREATAVAMRSPSFLERLFGNQPAAAVASHDFTATLPVRGGAPIMVTEEISDNGMLIESLLLAFAELVQLNPYAMRTYQFLEEVRVSPVGYDYGEVDDLTQLKLWFDEDQPTKTFRRELVEFIVRVDELEDTISHLSQSRWEKLRTWTCDHA